MKTRLCLWLAAVLAVAAGCDSETGVNPAPLTAPTTTSDGGGGATGYQAPIRKVELRSPMGNLPGNLLMDGDFEWTQILEGDSPQAAWYNFGSPQNHVRLATGGRCLSGLRCGIMRSQDLFYGRGSAAKASGMIATVAAKPPPGDGCEALVAYAIPCDFNGLSADLSAV